MAGGLDIVGTVGVDVEPDTSKFSERLRRQLEPESVRLGRDIGQSIGRPIAQQVSDSIGAGVRAGSRGIGRDGVQAGEDFGASFSKAVKTRVETALKGLPAVDITAKSTALDKKVQDVRRQLAELSDQKIGIDISDDEAILKVQQLRNSLSQLSRDVEKTRAKGGDIPLDVNALKALAELTALKRELDSLQKQAARPVRIPVEVESNGQFEQVLGARVRAAIASLPPVHLTSDSSESEQSIARIHAELEALSSQRVGVDIDADAALAQVRRLQSELAVLASESPNVHIAVDAGAASAQLAAVEAEVRRLAGDNPHINVDVDSGAAIAQLGAIDAASGRSVGSLGGLAVAGAALGPAIIPAAAAAAAAVAAIGPAIFAAGAGAGVLGLGFAGIGGAVSALSDDQASAGKTAAGYAGAQSQVASALDGVKTAQASLANTIASSADAQRRAGQQITNAERSLSQAQDVARRAQEALTQARADAVRSIEDLNLAVADGALAQRRANLDLVAAKADLDKALRDPRTSALQRQQAQLTFDQASQQVVDLGVQQARLAADQAAAAKAGVDGASQVVAAQDRIVQAQDQVAQSQQGVTDARLSEASQARQSAFQVAQAQQSIIAAQRSLEQATTSTGASGAASMDKLGAAMAGLTPIGQNFARFLFSLKPKLDELRAAAQNGLLPGVQEGITILLPFLPVLIQFVGFLAKVMGDLFVSSAKALTAPFWVKFFGFLASSAAPMITAFVEIILNLAKGFAGLILAFAPLSGSIGGGLLSLSEKFATFGTTVARNPKFQEFLAYVAVVGPIVLQTIGSIILAGLHLAEALAPIGGVALIGIKTLADIIRAIPVPILTALAAVIIIVILGLKLWNITVAITNVITSIFTAEMWNLNAALDANPIGAVILVIILFVAAIVLAWQNSATFRSIVTDAWDAIKTAVSVAWTQVLEPTFTAIGHFVTEVLMPAVLALWHNAIEPAFQGIGLAISIAWNQAILPAFQALNAFIGTFIVPIILLLWHQIIEPAFAGIGTAISTAAGIITPIFQTIGNWIALTIVPIVLFLWHEVIEPAWQGIAFAIGVAWTIIQVIFGVLFIIISQILIPIVLFLWHNVIEPAWQGIQVAISIAWAIIQVIFGLIYILFVAVLIPIFMFFWKNCIKPVFDAVSDIIGAAWKIIKPILEALGGFISDHVVPPFKTGVEAIGKAWEKIRDVAKVPIRFVIEKVLNEGLIDGYNALAGKFGAPKVGHIPLPDGFAGGGIYPGYTPGRDIGYIGVSGGEAIIRPEATKALGADWVHGINREARARGTAGARRFLGNFAVGGIEGGGGGGTVPAASTGGGILGILSDPIGWLKTQFAGPINLLQQFAGTDLGQLVTSIPRRIAESIFSSVKGILGFDSGGYLPPGITLVHNGTGRPEPVLTTSELQQMRNGQAAGGGQTTLNVYPQRADFTIADLTALQARQQALQRIGRPG